MADWFAQNAQMILYFAQLAYWFFMVVFVGYAVMQYKRWVNFQLGTGHSGHLRDAAEKDEPTPRFSIEEFVD